jgi:hypothetical protein
MHQEDCGCRDPLYRQGAWIFSVEEKVLPTVLTYFEESGQRCKILVW